MEREESEDDYLLRRIVEQVEHIREHGRRMTVFGRDVIIWVGAARGGGGSRLPLVCVRQDRHRQLWLLRKDAHGVDDEGLEMVL
jgi:hypothetical protein